MDEKMLPIGTVVTIKNSDSLLMIAGYCPQGSPTPEHIYDYSGFLYPYGYAGLNEVFQFDKDQIEEIVAYGYQDKEQMDFMELLMKDIPKLKHIK